jgi:hypothetical protein
MNINQVKELRESRGTFFDIGAIFAGKKYILTEVGTNTERLSNIDYAFKPLGRLGTYDKGIGTCNQNTLPDYLLRHIKDRGEVFILLSHEDLANFVLGNINGLEILTKDSFYEIEFNLKVNGDLIQNKYIDKELKVAIEKYLLKLI